MSARTRFRFTLAPLLLGLLSGAPATAEEGRPDGEEIARRVNARADGSNVSRILIMDLIDKNGFRRRRETRSFRRDFENGERRSVLFFDAPANLKGTALLTWDDPDPTRDDVQWLYLPDLRKARRVAMSERGRAFLGTDLSFEEIKKETRVSIEDYRWRTIGEEEVDGAACLVVEATAVDPRTARELGYGRILLRVDAERWIPRFGEYWDPRGEPIKTIRIQDIREIEGVWTAHRIEAENLRTGHRTVLEFHDVAYPAALPDDLFSEAALARGAP
ncbi:outer membrane lipoprotein-sorting protein [Myxococcota bacterium]|nr:outer membrane lipoprotein-sorting protein [Myxococcota bacterium]MCZ7619041.1 outer membrane lipoprotein-sorting protein [Myxococcota bacterium]